VADAAKKQIPISEHDFEMMTEPGESLTPPWPNGRENRVWLMNSMG